MHILDTTPEQRVANGVAWLDENGPADWRDRIDPATLSISDGQLCVLGQVFQAEADAAGLCSGYGYAVVFNQEPWEQKARGFAPPNAQLNGFCDMGPTTEPYGTLEPIWRAVIAEHRDLEAWSRELVNA